MVYRLLQNERQPDLNLRAESLYLYGSLTVEGSITNPQLSIDMNQDGSYAEIPNTTEGNIILKVSNDAGNKRSIFILCSDGVGDVGSFICCRIGTSLINFVWNAGENIKIHYETPFGTGLDKINYRILEL